MKVNNPALSLVGVTLAVLLAVSSASAQIYHPMSWVNDPDCFNPNYGLTGANSSNPCFTNNGIQRGSLFINSPIGTTLKLANPGDSLSLTGQVTMAGNLNAAGDLQFRVGLYYQGENKGDTNWLGYMFGNLTGSGSHAAHCLYIRNNPNLGNYGAGFMENAVMPPCEDAVYAPTWMAGTYDFKLAVVLTTNNTHRISWEMKGHPPLEYNQAGSYTNTNTSTCPPAFDQVGFLGGAALFQSPSTNNAIQFDKVAVTLTRAAKTP